MPTSIPVILDFTNQNTQNASIVTIMNLYLYGQVDRPEYYGGHIRDNPQTITVEIDSMWVMSDQGPGRFLQPSFFSAIQTFFNGILDVTNLPGFSIQTGLSISGADLIAANIYDSTGGDFILGFQQSEVASDALGAQNLQDLDARGFIFNSSSFQLVPEDVIFQFDGNGLPVSVSGLNIRPYSDQDNPDNFDFISGSGGNSTGNALLGAMYDPYGLGNTVIITYTDTGRDFGSMTLAEFNAAPTEIPQSNATQVAFATEVLQQSFLDYLGLYFDDQGRQIIYGSNDAESLSTGVTIPNIIVPDVFHLVGGGGNDTVTGSIGDDYLEGNGDDDTLDGGGGGDILVGGLGSDTLIGGAGLDFLFGDEHVDEFGVNRIASAPMDADPSVIVDIADYSGAAGLFGPGITLDTTTMTQAELDAGFLLVSDDAQGGQDILHSIEKIIGTGKDDQFIFSGDLSTGIVLEEIDGGDGTDILSFAGGMAGVTIGAASPLALTSIEQITLTDFVDTVTMSLTSLTGETVALNAGAQNDVLTITNESANFTGVVFIAGGTGEDTISLTSTQTFARNIVYADGANDTLNITSGYNDIYGGVGNDIINVSGGAQLVHGGAGDDIITAGSDSGGALLVGGDGMDTITGGSHASWVYELYGIQVTGLQDDSATLTASSTAVVVEDDNDVDTLIGGAGWDVFHVGNGDIIKNFIGNRDKIVFYFPESFSGLNIGSELSIFDGLTHSPDGRLAYKFVEEGGRVAVGFGVNNNNPTTIAELQAFFPYSIIFEDTTANDISSYFDFYMNSDAFNSGFNYEVGAVIPDPAEDIQEVKSGATVMEAPLSQANQILGTLLDDNINGTAADDEIYAGNGIDTVYASDGHDIVYGGLRGDTLHGDAGNDTLYGELGDDIMYGGDGEDTLYGGVGNDILFGSSGDDTLYGGTGDDELFGGQGSDRFIGGRGSDIFHGSFGDFDIADFSDLTSSVTIGLNEVDNWTGTAVFGADTDTLSNVQVIIGTSFDDTIVARSSLSNSGVISDELFYGGDGDDLLDGWYGDDQLFGENGDDELIGSFGNDV